MPPVRPKVRMVVRQYEILRANDAGRTPRKYPEHSPDTLNNAYACCNDYKSSYHVAYLACQITWWIYNRDRMEWSTKTIRGDSGRLILTVTVILPRISSGIVPCSRSKTNLYILSSESDISSMQIQQSPYRSATELVHDDVIH